MIYNQLKKKKVLIGGNMKKVFLFASIIFCLIFSGCQKSSRADSFAKEDIETFKYYLENAYIFYDDLQEQNSFKFNTNRILKRYRKLKKNFPKSHVENGINQDALMNALANFLYNIRAMDNHLYLKGKNGGWIVYPPNVVFTSDYYFSKEGDSFVLSKSPDGSLTGKVFTGNPEDIKKVIRNKKEIYQFAPNLREEKREEAILLLDGKKHKVPVKKKTIRYSDDEKLFELKETEDTLYLKINTFSVMLGSEEYESFTSFFKEIAGKIEGKKNLIIDLRGNTGGLLKFPKELMAAVYNIWDDEIDKNQLMEFLNYQSYGNLYMDSEAVAKSRYDLAVKNNENPDYLAQAKEYYEYIKGTGKREVVGNDKVNMTILPQYKKKKLKTKIFVLTDYYTASASEATIGYLYMMDKENITLVGLNSSGAFVGVDVLPYELPNSKITVYLTAESYKKTIICSLIDSWKGENYGFVPDYWVTDDSMTDTLEYLTGDKAVAMFEYKGK
jgi:hypothetical protein